MIMFVYVSLCVCVCVSELSACTPWNSKDVPTLGCFCVVYEFLHLHTATADANGDDKAACAEHMHVLID